MTRRGSGPAFLGVYALLFAASVASTIEWCGTMSAMGGMPMPGEWSMSMAWMRAPGQTWTAAAWSFVGMWVVMMMAMMLPSLIPMLWQYRQGAALASAARLNGLTTLVGASYFFVWAVHGVVVFAVGATLASLEMQHESLARLVPSASGAVVLIAGALQFTRWKSHQLACCRSSRPGVGMLSADARSAWGHGLRLGVQCSYCCAGLTAILLVLGVMDLRVMAVVGAAITAERLAAGDRVAHAIGVLVLASGLFLLVRATGLA